MPIKTQASFGCLLLLAVGVGCKTVNSRIADAGDNSRANLIQTLLLTPSTSLTLFDGTRQEVWALEYGSMKTLQGAIIGILGARASYEELAPADAAAVVANPSDFLANSHLIDHANLIITALRFTADPEEVKTFRAGPTVAPIYQAIVADIAALRGSAAIDLANLKVQLHNYVLASDLKGGMGLFDSSIQRLVQRLDNPDGNAPQPLRISARDGDLIEDLLAASDAARAAQLAQPNSMDPILQASRVDAFRIKQYAYLVRNGLNTGSHQSLLNSLWRATYMLDANLNRYIAAQGQQPFEVKLRVVTINKEVPIQREYLLQLQKTSEADPNRYIYVTSTLPVSSPDAEAVPRTFYNMSLAANGSSEIVYASTESNAAAPATSDVTTMLDKVAEVLTWFDARYPQQNIKQIADYSSQTSATLKEGSQSIQITALKVPTLPVPAKEGGQSGETGASAAVMSDGADTGGSNDPATDKPAAGNGEARAIGKR